MLRVREAGLQSTLQGKSRTGYRHFGVPYAGAADLISMQLANRLVANTLNETCLEITYGGFEAEIMQACAIAITGAIGEMNLNNVECRPHVTLHLKAGDNVRIGPPRKGCRTYLAIHSGFKASTHFQSTSTYLPAALGGLEGRALQAGDVLQPNGPARHPTTLETPNDVRPTMTHAIALRTCVTSETHLLSAVDQDRFFNETFTIGRQATRMGVSLDGHLMHPESDGLMPSAPVFPGTVQCPPSGVPIVLLCDAQTTGGYPRIASIARCDRHLLGQARPGNQIQLLHRSPEAAQEAFKQKQAFLDQWLMA